MLFTPPVGAKPVELKSPQAMADSQVVADSFALGLDAALNGHDFASMFLGAWNTDIAGKDAELKTAGKALGGTLVAAIDEGVAANIRGIRQTVAYWVAPDVAELIKSWEGPKP